MTNPIICEASLHTAKLKAGSKFTVANLLPAVFVGEKLPTLQNSTIELYLKKAGKNADYFE
jgi:hypothetical protein